MELEIHGYSERWEMSDGVLRCVEKAFVLLEGFTSRDEIPVGVAELSRRTGLAKSTVHRLLKIFQDFRVVEQWNGKCRLSPRMTELGEFACPWPPGFLRAYLQPWLLDLHRVTHSIARASVLYGSFEVCVAAVYDHHWLDLALRLEDRAPAGETVAGKAMLAHSPADLQDKAAQDLHLTPDGAADDVASFYQELTQIRKAGWASSSEGAHRGLVTVASPVLNEQGEAVAALAVTEPTGFRKPAELTTAILSVADAASRKMHGETGGKDGAEVASAVPSQRSAPFSDTPCHTAADERNVGPHPGFQPYHFR
jgi:DNA-binding IclR family transcriptional regulator